MDTSVKVQVIDPNLFDHNGLLQLVREIIFMKNETWLATYPNEEAGITREDIGDNFRPIEENVRGMADTINNDWPDLRHFWFASNEEKIIGFTVGVKEDKENTLEAIYIHPDFQAKGVGKALMEQVLNWFGDSKSIKVEVAAYNTTAIFFYQKYGFKIESEGVHELRRLNPPKNFPVFIMRKKF